MSEFIREVDEEYRRERIGQIWKRYSGLIIALAILLVAGVGGWRYWQHVEQTRSQAAGARYQEAIVLARDGKPEEAEKALQALAADAPSGYRQLARFRGAAELGQAKPEEGAKAYDALANDDKLDPLWRDLARLRAAMLRLEGSDKAAVTSSLQGLAAPTNAWRHSARELLGLIAMKKGDYEDAARWFDQIAADRDTPQGLRTRLEIYSALVAGGPVRTQ